MLRIRTCIPHQILLQHPLLHKQDGAVPRETGAQPIVTVVLEPVPVVQIEAGFFARRAKAHLKGRGLIGEQLSDRRVGVCCRKGSLPSIDAHDFDFQFSHRLALPWVEGNPADLHNGRLGPCAVPVKLYVTSPYGVGIPRRGIGRCGGRPRDDGSVRGTPSQRDSREDEKRASGSQSSPFHGRPPSMPHAPAGGIRDAAPRGTPTTRQCLRAPSRQAGRLLKKTLLLRPRYRARTTPRRTCDKCSNALCFSVISLAREKLRSKGHLGGRRGYTNQILISPRRRGSVPAMPRAARLDAPGALHHVMVRGIEQGLLFRDDRDRAVFVARLAHVVHRTGLSVFAWALLPNHLHLLVRTPSIPDGRPYRPILPTAMRQLLTGYAGTFNRRHKRVGHLVQNRYRSTLVEEEAYLLELVRYIHLNPLRAGVVRDLASLARYPWSGHSAILGHVVRSWQATTEVLGRFGTMRRTASRQYRAFVAAGVPQGRRPEFQGGGLRRSAGNWRAVAMLRRGRESWAADERILGSGPFVEAVLRESAPSRTTLTQPQALAALPGLLERCAQLWGVGLAELQHGSRRRRVAQARAVAASLAVVDLGLPAAVVARELAVTPAAVRRGIERGPTLLKACHVEADGVLRTLLRKIGSMCPTSP